MHEIEPTSALGKIAGLLGKPAFDAARAQWSRRGAGSSPPPDMASVDRELEEALDTLTGDAATLLKHVAGVAKATLSGRPGNLAEQDAREWLRTPGTRELARRGTMSLVLGDDLVPIREAAAADYATVTADAEWWGGVLFDETVGFLALTLDHRLTPGDRLAVQVTNVRADRLEEVVGALDARLDAQPGLMAAAVGEALAAGLPLDVLETHLVEAVRRERRWRGLDEEGGTARVVALARRVLDGDLRHAPAAARIEVLRLAAQLQGRTEALVEAAAWIDAARGIGATDLAVDEARLAIRRKDWPAAFGHLELRTDRVSNGLLLEAIHGRDGREAALRYQQAHLPASALGGFSLPTVAAWLLDNGRDADAEALLCGTDADHVAENPTLPFVRARLRAALMAPAGSRRALYETSGNFAQVEALRDDGEGMRLRAAALADLADARREGEAPPAYLSMVDANRLFLALGSPEEPVREAATRELVVLLADPERVMDHAWLALAHDIPFDDRQLRAALERMAMLGGLSAGALQTALQLAMRERDGEELLPFLAANRDQLRAQMPVELGYGLEIEALARRGRIPDARARLAEAEEALGPELAARLASIVDEQAGSNAVALRLAAFEATGSDVDLGLLVRALGQARDERAGEYGARLWRVGHRTADAVAALNAFFDAGRDAEIDAFLAELGLLTENDQRLSEHRAWALYRQGDLEGARSRVDSLRSVEPDRASLRQLAVNVLVEAGDMVRLGALAAEDFERREHRDAEQLLQAAGLAHAAGSALADELARAAVALSPADPRVLLMAFGIAVRRGRDWEPEASEWLRRAIELSGDAGPIQRGDLRDLIRRREEDARGLSDLDRMVMAGEVPLSMAARPLGTTLSELILGRLAQNPPLRPLARLCLPLIAGGRGPIDLTGAERVGLDPAALMALHLCGLLPAALAGIPGVVIPAGTLPLLLHDLERADRPQQSRIDQASRIKALIDAGRIGILDDAGEDDVPALHGRAAALGGRLVHTSPINEPGSLAERRLDPTPFADLLSSPHALIVALARRGELTIAERDAALERLGGYGGDWPDEPGVDLGLPLVVHPLALSGLEYAGALKPLVDAGARLHVPRQAIAMLDWEISQGGRAADLERSIGAVRDAIGLALSTGTAVPGPFRRRGRDDEDGDSMATVPLLSLLQDGSAVDVLVSGDRMVNGYGAFTDTGGVSRAVASPLDVIDQLWRVGAITAERRLAARRSLREAGVALVPVEVDELVAAAGEGDWAHGPGRSLRAIRDSIHLPLLRGAVRMPGDRPWLADVAMSLALAIRQCWRDLPTPALARSASDFLLEMMPGAAGWIADDASPDAARWAAGVAVAAYSLVSMPAEVPRDRLGEFGDWWADAVAPRLDGRDRAALDLLIERIRLYLLLDRAEQIGGTEWPADKVVRLIASRIPDVLFQRLLDYPDVRQALGGRAAALSLVGGDATFAELSRFFTAAMSGEAAELAGIDGATLATAPRVEADGSLTAETNGSRGGFFEAGLFAADAAGRVRALDALLMRRTMAPSQAGRWRAVLAAGPPDEALFRALMTELEATPQAFAEGIRGTGEVRYRDLVPTDPLLYRNMLDPAAGDGTLPGTLGALSAGHASLPSAAAAVHALAPLAVSPDLPLAALSSTLDDGRVARMCGSLVDAGDPFGALAGFEMAAFRAASQPCLEAATAALERLLGDDGAALDRAVELFCICATVVLDTFDSKGLLAEAPLALRRCAALAEAGHMCRLLHGFEVDPDGLLADAVEWAGARWGIADLVDRVSAPAWTRLWLRPQVLGPYLQVRLERAAALVPDGSGPARWTELLEANAARLSAAGFDAGLTMPGPLDEFGTAMPVDGADGEEFAAQLATAQGEEAESIMFLFLWAHRPPADLSAFQATIEALLARSEGAARRNLAALALSVAARWRLPGLSGAVMALARGSADEWGLEPIRMAELSVAATLARGPDLDGPAVAEALHPVVFGGMDPNSGRAVAGLIGLLVDLRPDWISGLERLRSACVLGASPAPGQAAGPAPTARSA